jgi:uncharacterized membrane protein
MPFWLSHHPPDELDRCYRLGGVHLCARCAGTYPVLLATVAAQLLSGAPLDHRLDVPACAALVLPATLDWALGRARPHGGSNLLRTGTGALLGLGLGRSLFIHLQRPLPLALLIQAAVVTIIALPVILATYLRRAGR